MLCQFFQKKGQALRRVHDLVRNRGQCANAENIVTKFAALRARQPIELQLGAMRELAPAAFKPFLARGNYDQDWPPTDLATMLSNNSRDVGSIQCASSTIRRNGLCSMSLPIS